jgi:sorting nexin-1/2
MRSFGETISSSNPFSKTIETDDWFAFKKSEMDALETQLKTLLKAVEGVVKQRKGQLQKRERGRGTKKGCRLY